MKTIFKFLYLIVAVLFISNCARTGRPEGGPKDENAPLFVTAKPPYESTKFDEKEIEAIKRDISMKLYDFQKTKMETF